MRKFLLQEKKKKKKKLYDERNVIIAHYLAQP